MISLPSFQNSRKASTNNTSVKVDKSVGFDGYRQCDREIICKFQAIVEREADCDYDALSAALRQARDPQFVVTLVNLRRAYNDSVYSSAQYAYVSR